MIKLVDNDLPFQYYVKGTLLSVYALSRSAVARTLIGGGGYIFIYSCSARRISFEIDCFYGM